ncbi:protein 6 [Medicago cytorhabdovirus A]|nr:protein 6 [Medicago cytorhabdovirus A]
MGDYTDALKRLTDDEVAFEIPGYDVTTKDMLIFVMAVCKVILLIIVYILFKTRMRQPGKMRIRWT